VFPTGDENPRRTTPVLTWSLIGINVGIFLWSLTDFDHVVTTWGFTPGLFVPATLLTAMFLHGGPDHLFGNLWYLFLFGDNVEDRMGKALFLPFYLGAGLVATLTHYATDPGSLVPTIGASGAISGVLGAYLVFFPQVRVRVWIRFLIIRVPAWGVIGFWFALQLLFGVVSLTGGQGSGIAFWAHIGGFAFGVIVALVFRPFGRAKPDPWRAPPTARVLRH